MANGTPPVKIRRNAAALPKWDPILLWYARAVGEMKDTTKYPPTTPKSWTWQAAVHGFDLTYPEWQNWTAGQPLPSSTDQKLLWAQCQHGTWYFLPWHRMYLALFEDIVQSIIIGLGGPSDWALPYWNYSKDTPARAMPAAFLDPVAPFAAQNPLYEPTRQYDASGNLVLGSKAVAITGSLSVHQFQGTQLGFGGPDSGGPQHAAVHNAFGALESQPHNVVHDDIGGIMGDPTTSAFDPIFWLHHTNIDRLWEVWRQADPANVDPTDLNWLTRWPFSFRDGTGNPVACTPSQVQQTLAPVLNYQYDDTSVPAGVASAPPAATTTMSLPIIQPSVAEMVGATSQPVPLSGETRTVDLPVGRPTGPALLSERAGRPQHVYLHIENITGTGRPASYHVYINLPAETGAEAKEAFYVGIVSMFGLQAASRADQPHGGRGLHYTFDITPLVVLPESRRLLEQGKYTVTFEPRRTPGANSSVSVGRISLYYQ
jgi:tyrosinase